MAITRVFETHIHADFMSGARELVRQWPWIGATPAQLAAALIFGGAFGFLLQKGGVAKFDILIGVLLLEKFTVVKMMLTAIIVGMIGVRLLRRLGVLELQIKETVSACSAWCSVRACLPWASTVRPARTGAS